MDHSLGGYVGGKQAALESAFDYNDKSGAISKCRETKACKGVFLRMPEGVWVLSTGQAPNPRYKGEGSIAIPMKSLQVRSIYFPEDRARETYQSLIDMKKTQ